LSLRSNPGLELANAFGVKFQLNQYSLLGSLLLCARVLIIPRNVLPEEVAHVRISVVIAFPEVTPHLQEHLNSTAAQTRPADRIVRCEGSPEEAIRACDGDVIVFSAQDNVWFPEMLARIDKTFSDFPDSGAVLANAELVDEDLRPLGCSLWESIGFGPTEQKALKDKKKLSGLLRQDAIATLAFRSNYKSLILPLPKDISAIAWIALVVCAAGEVCLIREPLSNYRLHTENQFGFAPAANNGDNSVAKELSLLRLVSERLSLNETSELVARMDHLATRSSLPAEKSKRIRRIMKELLTRRYHRYSYGFNSALKDILVPPQRN